MLRSSGIILFAAAVLGLPASLLADSFTYTYTGKPFIKLGPSYNSSEYVSGSFTLLTALPPNLTSLTEIDPISFSFGDGVFTISSSSSVLGEDIEVATDAAGAITQWDVGLAGLCVGCYSPGNSPGYTIIFAPENELHTSYTTEEGSGQIDWYDVSEYEDKAGDVSGYVGGGVSGEMAGTWAVTEVSAVPEPGSLMLASTGFLMLVRRAYKSRGILRL